MNIESVKVDLIKKRGSLVERVDHLESDIRRENSPLSQDFEEQAVEKENDEVLDALDDATREEVAQIDQALLRIEKGQYHVCSSCAAKISTDRLIALPYTTTCVKCAS